MSKNILNDILNQFQNINKISAYNKLQKYSKKHPKDLVAHYNMALMLNKLDRKKESILVYEYVCVQN